MSPSQDVSYEGLQAEVVALREYVTTLTREKAELEVVVEMITTHGDFIEEELWNRVSLIEEDLQDPASKLYHRRFMEEVLERELSRCLRHDLPLTLILVRIDHFDTAAITWSPTISAMVLQDLGKILHTSIRREDFACRYSDDTFGLILPQAASQHMKLRAEQMRLKVKSGVKTPYQDDILGVTVSMGVAGYPEHGQNGQALLNAASVALELAQHNGGDRVEIALAPALIQ